MNRYEEYEKFLRPCRCGGKVKITGGTYGYPSFKIKCLKCGGEWAMGTYSPKETAEQWGMINMGNIQIGSGNVIKNSVISSNSGVVVIGNEVTINGVKMPPCPAKGHNSTIIDNKVYLNGYELVNGKWKKRLKALWYKWF